LVIVFSCLVPSGLPEMGKVSAKELRISRIIQGWRRRKRKARLSYKSPPGFRLFFLNPTVAGRLRKGRLARVFDITNCQAIFSRSCSTSG
jgi:hypothetical protein